MPMAPQGPVKVQQSPTQSRSQLDLTSPTVGQTDANIGSMGLNTQQQLQQQQQGMMRPQAAPTANGPVMSNGKPALLRGAAARDNGAWAQGPSMVRAV